MKAICNLWDNIKQANLCIIGFQEENKKKGGLKIYLKKLWLKNFKSKGNKYQDTGSTEDPKQVESKQAHTKTYYYKNGRG